MKKQPANIKITHYIDDVEYEVFGIVYPPVSARLSGPSEDCYPGDPAEASISHMVCVSTGEEFELDTLDEEELEYIHNEMEQEYYDSEYHRDHDV